MSSSIDDFGLSADGYRAPRQADFLCIIRNSYDAELVALGFNEVPDYERDTFLGQITEIMSFLLGQQGEHGQAVYDARSVSNATGLQLDNIALIVGVTRQPATKGTVTLTCTGTDGTEIPEGKIVEGGGTDGRARWIIADDVVIGDVTTGTVDVTAVAEEEGQVVALVGEIDTIVTQIDGWDAVTNAADADPGDERETDSELRGRRQRALQVAGSTNTNAIRAALLLLDDLSGAVVLDNKTGFPVTADGVTLVPYSVGCIVAPDSLSTSQQQTVVRAIYDNLGAGTATSGDESGTVTKADGRSETINFFFAADTDVNLVWVLALEPGFDVDDVEQPLLDLVTDFFLTLAPGETVFPTPLIALAATVDGILNVTTLTLNGVADPATHDAVELPVLGTHAVS